MKRQLILNTLLGGIPALASHSFAQTTAVPAAPDPAIGGLARTKTPAGVANPTQRPDGSAAMSRDAVKSEERIENKNDINTTVPKGKASTVTNKQPSAATPTGDMTRAEVEPTRDELKPQKGEVDERPDVPTNRTGRTGTPK